MHNFLEHIHNRARLIIEFKGILVKLENVALAISVE